MALVVLVIWRKWSDLRSQPWQAQFNRFRQTTIPRSSTASLIRRTTPDLSRNLMIHTPTQPLALSLILGSLSITLLIEIVPSTFIWWPRELRSRPPSQCTTLWLRTRRLWVRARLNSSLTTYAATISTLRAPSRYQRLWCMLTKSPTMLTTGVSCPVSSWTATYTTCEEIRFEVFSHSATTRYYRASTCNRVSPLSWQEGSQITLR